ncbi:MAG: arginine--tRNA ligase [Candidatus Paceibacterota bacterium]
MIIKDELAKVLEKVAINCGVAEPLIKFDYPEDPKHGDLSTNIALVNSKKLGISSKDLAEKIVTEFKKGIPDFIHDINVAGPGFINFFIKDQVVAGDIVGISCGLDKKNGQFTRYFRGEASKKVLVEYTDPNTFKAFHIGHLMSNAIGESISRLIEYSGVQVTRICYPSDIGLHIAKSIWALQKHLDKMPADSAPIKDRTEFLGKMYVEGTNAYDSDPVVKKEIDILNMVIYNKSSSEVDELYVKGRQWSIDHFELIYKQFGTKFNEYIYESEIAPVGLEIVKEFLKKGVFEESEGAVVFKGEKYGLHTRVFISSLGLPTYETKDVGLNVMKFKKYPDTDQSIIITASEQNDYFKVLTKVLTLIDSKNGLKTKHVGHGMMRFASGKMSSRTGNVVTAETLLADIKELVSAKIKDRNFTNEEIEEISNVIAVGAIKYTILRSSVGSDIVFDTAASISFEGDSGPYLQYAVVRANSIIEKAREEGIENLDAKNTNVTMSEKVGLLEKLLIRFPDIIERAKNEYAPQIVVNYLIELAGTFNSFYASQIIVDKNNKLSPYYLALTKVFKDTMTDGLWVLGIKVPEKM